MYFQLTCVQCTSRVARAQHMSYLQIFLRHEPLLTFFYKLGRELCCKALQYTA